MKVYALKVKGRFAFTCLANNSDEFEKKIQERYWQWRGIQPKGAVISIDDFLATYERVCLTIEPYSEEIVNAAAKQ